MTLKEFQINLLNHKFVQLNRNKEEKRNYITQPNFYSTKGSFIISLFEPTYLNAPPKLFFFFKDNLTEKSARSS